MDKNDLALLAATSAYAAILDRYKHLWEPDATWLEVVIGTTLCLSAAARRVRGQSNPGWKDYEWAVWRSFIIGGMPIVAWQVARAKWRYQQVVRYVTEERR